MSQSSPSQDHAEQAAARFDEWADSYGEDRISPWLRFYQSKSISLLDLTEKSTFLDVGCGTGWAVREVAGRCRSTCGIDISPKMIEKAKRQATLGEDVEFKVANAEAIPYSDEYFDAVLCTFSFHHYKDPVASLREIKRVLKPGGRFVLTDSARDVSFAIWLQDRLRRHFERSHVRYYTRQEVKNFLATVAFELDGEPVAVRKFMDHRKVFTGVMIVSCVKP